MKISFNSVTMSFGFGNILDDISFEINDGEKIAIVGENGSGKSTMLKLLLKEYMPTSGSISITKGLNIGYLSQERGESNLTVKEYLYENYNEILELEKRIDKLINGMQDAKNVDKVFKQYSNAIERYELLDGYSLKARFDKVVAQFDIEDKLQLNYNELNIGDYVVHRAHGIGK